MYMVNQEQFTTKKSNVRSYSRSIAIGLSALMFAGGGAAGYAYEGTINDYQDAVCANIDNDPYYSCEKAGSSEIKSLEAKASEQSKLAGGLVIASVVTFLAASLSEMGKKKPEEDYEAPLSHSVS